MKKRTFQTKLLAFFVLLTLLCSAHTAVYAAEDPASNSNGQEQTASSGAAQEAGTASASVLAQAPVQSADPSADPAATQAADPSATPLLTPLGAPSSDPAATQGNDPSNDPAPAQGNDPVTDPSAPQADDRIETAAVYLRLKEEVPADIHNSHDPVGFGPRQNNNHPYFRVRINLSLLDRLLTAAGKTTSVKIGSVTYYSHLSTGTDNSTAFWSYVMDAMESDADRALFSRYFGSAYAGYVLKQENDGWHIDGVMVDQVYMTELYDRTTPSGAPLYDMLTKTGSPASFSDVQERFDARLKAVAGATRIEWQGVTGGVFYKADHTGYRFRVEAAAGDSGVRDDMVTYDHVTENLLRVAGFSLTYDTSPDPSLADDVEKDIASHFSMTVTAADGVPVTHADLKDRYEVLTYTIDTIIPDSASTDTVRLTDTLVPAFTFVGSASDVSVEIGGTQITGAASVTGQTLTVEIPDTYLKRNRGERLLIRFQVQIRQDVVLNGDYLLHDADGRVRIPNEAEYYCSLHDFLPDAETRRSPQDGEDGSFLIRSNQVTVTPPDPKIELLVNGRLTSGSDPVVLSDRYDEVTYTIRTKIPEREGLTSFRIEDPLPSALSFRGEVTVMIDGVRVTGLTQLSGQTLIVIIPNSYLTKDFMGKQVTVTFRAGITSGSDLTGYISDSRNGVLISNTVSYQLRETEAPVFSNPAQIALSGRPVISEEVDGALHTDLSDYYQVFTYTLRTRVPERAFMNSFVVGDRIADVLEYVGDAKVWIGGYPVEGLTSVSGQQLLMTLSGNRLMSSRGKAVEISFEVRVRKDADITPYLEGNGIPNESWVRVDDETAVSSNRVTVRPTGKPTQLRESTLVSIDEETDAVMLGVLRDTDGQAVAGARRGQTGDEVQTLQKKTALLALFGFAALLLASDAWRAKKLRL